MYIRLSVEPNSYLSALVTKVAVGRSPATTSLSGLTRTCSTSSALCLTDPRSTKFDDDNDASDDATDTPALSDVEDKVLPSWCSAHDPCAAGPARRDGGDRPVEDAIIGGRTRTTCWGWAWSPYCPTVPVCLGTLHDVTSYCGIWNSHRILRFIVKAMIFLFLFICLIDYNF